jgi:hypothetical protein
VRWQRVYCTLIKKRTDDAKKELRPENCTQSRAVMMSNNTLAAFPAELFIDNYFHRSAHGSE